MKGLKTLNARHASEGPILSGTGGVVSQWLSSRVVPVARGVALLGGLLVIGSATEGLGQESGFPTVTLLNSGRSRFEDVQSHRQRRLDSPPRYTLLRQWENARGGYAHISYYRNDELFESLLFQGKGTGARTVATRPFARNPFVYNFSNWPQHPSLLRRVATHPWTGRIAVGAFCALDVWDVADTVSNRPDGDGLGWSLSTAVAEKAFSLGWIGCASHYLGTGPFILASGYKDFATGILSELASQHNFQVTQALLEFVDEKVGKDRIRIVELSEKDRDLGSAITNYYVVLKDGVPVRLFETQQERYNDPPSVRWQHHVRQSDDGSFRVISANRLHEFDLTFNPNRWEHNPWRLTRTVPVLGYPISCAEFESTIDDGGFKPSR